MDTLQVNIHEAKTQLSKLIQAALNGKQIIIARGNKPVVRLEVLPEARGARKIGNANCAEVAGLPFHHRDTFDLNSAGHRGGNEIIESG